MRRWRAALVATCALGVLAGCTNAPPPPLVTTEVARTTPSKPVNLNEVVVGVDTVEGGYNPHRVSDQSAITSALSAALLPSVFRPGPDGTPRLDRTLMLDASVTRVEPYTVTYRLRPEASWSDSAPIAAEDFVYLWEQVREAPGMLDGAGYRLIDNISSREAGRVVEVTFDRPYPGWRSLFSGLLPAHLLKDMPGGWAGALRDSFPVTGGPYSVRNLDRDRGEVILERNDRYWDQPASLDRIVLRRADAVGIAGALRSGHDQLALARLDRDGLAAMTALAPAATVREVPRPTVATVLLRPAAPALSDQRVRAAVAAMIDRRALAAVGTGGGPGAAADSQVLAPSAPDYAATAPAAPANADALLTEAGYSKATGVWASASGPLSLVVAAPANRPAYVAMAKEVQRVLTAAGVQAKVVTPDAEQLFTELLAGPGGVDLVLAPESTAGDPLVTLATRFGCARNTEGESRTVPANALGFCDPALQQTIDAALSGAVPRDAALRAAEPVLWERAVALPLYQETDVLVTRREMTGVTPGSPSTGPFEGAAGWRRQPS